MTQEHELAIEGRIDHWKSQLIDLSLKNRLLNFQGSKSASIQLIKPAAQDLYDQLVKKGRELTVFQSGTASRQNRIDPESKDIALGKGEILPATEGEDLVRALVRLRTKARASMKERGFNVLFVSFGMLRWKDRSGEMLRSPLILVPVELKRGTCFDPYKLSMLDEDVVLNPTLVKKMQLEYAVTLPQMPNSSSIDISAFFGQIMTLIDGNEWAIDDGVFLSLFSFAKSGMYNDLESFFDLARSHPVIRALAGDQTELKSPYSDDLSLDDIPPRIVHQILDADSSQQMAIEAAKHGESFVLQGPPGTGKSQTIANIIAESISSGKTVLFVSEKMAALDVVKRRLDQCHLGEYCLELHSHKASKTAILAELSKGLEGCPSSEAHENGLQRLESVRQELSGYVEALHSPRLSTSWSAFDVQSRLAVLNDAADLPFDSSGLSSLNLEQFRELTSLVQVAADHYEQIKCMDSNPWRTTNISAWTFGTRADVTKRLLSFRESMESCRALFATAAGKCDIECPRSIQESHVALALLKNISETPFPLESWLDSGRINDIIARADEIRAAHADYSRSLEWLLIRYEREIMDVDTHAIFERMESRKGNIFRFFDRDLRQDADLLRRMRKHSKKIRLDEILFDLKEINLIKENGRRLRESGPEIKRLLGSFYDGESTDWEKLSRSLEWTNRFLSKHEASEGGRLVRVICHEREFVQKLGEELPIITDALGQLEIRAQALSEVFNTRDVPSGSGPIKEVSFEALSGLIGSLLEKIDKLQEWIELKAIVDNCVKSGLGSFLEEAGRAQIPPSEFQRAFLKRFYTQWLDAAYTSDEVLRNFNSERHSSVAQEFCKLDRYQMELASRRIRMIMSTRRREMLDANPQEKESELYILKREIAKKRGHKPLRQLFTEIHGLLPLLKPCLLMSPLSVSQFLDPQVLKFDLVIFDEASQIRPEDAVGAIMRGSQIIIVGDAKQLPPSSFFVTMEEGEGAEELDSILDECSTIGIKQRTLLWHYRSRHESLIAFSNLHFYANRLLTFPSAREGVEGAGIEFVHVPEGIYDRGRTRKNVPEASRTAELIFNHFSEFPERSLGVVAFSEAQQMAILEEVERLRRSRPEFEAYFDEDCEEEFFVKNLESVQGDERDIMFFCVGYGRDADGEISMNFGPLNSIGGQRRLNVAITRARIGAKIISSLQPEDLDVSRSQCQGVKLLREYMEFARSGGKRSVLQKEGGEETLGITESIAQALREKGIEVQKNVGCSDYKIDIAVVDPDHPGDFLIGIELDGEAYRSARTVRERERLRKEMLEKLGWRIHRVWSRDWIHRPQKELEKIVGMVEEIRRSRAEEISDEAIFSVNDQNIIEGGSEAASSEAEAMPAESTQIVGTFVSRRPFSVSVYRTTTTEDISDLLKKNSASSDREIVAKVVEIEGPVHRTTVVRRMAELLGRGSRKGKINSASRAWTAMDSAIKHEMISVKGEFLWSKGMNVPPVRYSPAGVPPRDISEISLSEVEQAIYMCVGPTPQPVDKIVSRAARLLSLDLNSERVRLMIDEAVLQMAEERLLEYGERSVMLPSTEN